VLVLLAASQEQAQGNRCVFLLFVFAAHGAARGMWVDCSAHKKFKTPGPQKHFGWTQMLFWKGKNRPRDQFHCESTTFLPGISKTMILEGEKSVPGPTSRIIVPQNQQLFAAFLPGTSKTFWTNANHNAILERKKSVPGPISLSLRINNFFARNFKNILDERKCHFGKGKIGPGANFIVPQNQQLFCPGPQKRFGRTQMPFWNKKKPHFFDKFQLFWRDGVCRLFSEKRKACFIRTEQKFVFRSKNNGLSRRAARICND
jgi:hypothetical protein